MRIERDFIGTLEIPDDALYGIHSLRARTNFPDGTAFHKEWYMAMGAVKQACYSSYRSFKKSAQTYKAELPIPFVPNEIIDLIEKAALEVSEGQHFESFIVPAIQGGAGTSINMNVNEIIANRALVLSGQKAGTYSYIDPIEQANIYQSTNDVVPTALKVTVLRLLLVLEQRINALRAVIEEVEKENHSSLRIGYTQMQEAVPSSYGRLFSTYAEALSRDWWRVSKCFERIKTVNLGGGAIGSGIATPRYFIMEVVQELQKITGLPVTRAENLQESTSNLDAFVEVHAIMKAHAVNIEKMVSDIRLLASDISGAREIEIPKKQVGSSIMPGKINPVIPEFAVSISHKVYANDQIISGLCALGTLELNAYLPLIGHSLIESLKLLIAANESLTQHLFTGITIHTLVSEQKLYHSPVIVTALTPLIGYNRASELAKEMKASGLSVFEISRKLNIMDEERLKLLLAPENLLKLGFSLKDIE
jgi:aspartate ammonia-lyase